MKNRIGILGGTFNPIHNGHLLLAQCAIEQYELEKVIFIPNNVSYFKSDIPMPGADIRYEMTRLAIAGHTGFEISDIEIRRSGNSYTYETIGTLKAFYPEKPPFPFLHIDTTWKFREMIEFRDEVAKKYGIDLIPTQVFLDANGKELMRHEGFYPEEEIDKFLQSQGVNIN